MPWRVKPNECVRDHLRRRPRPGRSGADEPQGGAADRQGRRDRALPEIRTPRQCPRRGRWHAGARRDRGGAGISRHHRDRAGRSGLWRRAAYLLRRLRAPAAAACRRRSRRRHAVRGRPVPLWFVHAPAQPYYRPRACRGGARHFRHVGLLDRERCADHLWRRRPDRGAGDARRGDLARTAAVDRRAGGDEARPQSAKSASRAASRRPRRAGDLCRARHHGRRESVAACRQDRRRGALLLDDSGSRPRAPAMTGWLAIAGLGPGAAQLVTPEVTQALAEATDLVGYAPYVARVPPRAGLTCHSSDNRRELDRASLALRLAAEGKRVAVVSSGDPGVFAMAAAVFEAVDAAARIGAPLGHDFCAINLSDNLKPWDLVEHRLRLAAQADFVIALYNPLSSARPWQLGRAFELLREELPGTVPVVFASAVSEACEAIDTVALREAVASRADMRTLVLIGSSRTRLIARAGGKPFVYTPRSAGVLS